MYYLKNRYYSPEIGRFISADSQLNMSIGLSCLNLYAYCGNNPANRIDENGQSWEDIKNWFKKKADTVKSYVKKVVDSFVQKTVSKILPGRTSSVLKTFHYDVRANANGKHPTYSQASSNKLWTEVPENQTKYHNNGIGNLEKKYTHNDGREAVFDGDTLLPMTDPRYVATYNYCPIQQLPSDPGINDYMLYGTTMAGHAVLDVIPYYIWGNSSNDTTTIIDRLLLSF